MLGFVIIMVNLDYAKLNPYYSIPTIICGEPFTQNAAINMRVHIQLFCFISGIMIYCITGLTALANPTQRPYGGTVVGDSLVFSDSAAFNNATFKNSAAFNNARFKDIANFALSKFEKNALFSKANFQQRAFFYSATINNIDFSGAKFEGPSIDFSSATVKNNTNFTSSTFTGIAEFSGATLNNANFIGTSFKNNASFKETKFNKANFSHTIFSGSADFSSTECKDSTNFTYCRFEKNVDFDKSIFKKNFIITNTQFMQGVDLRSTKLKQNNTIIIFNHKTYFPKGKLQVYWYQIKDRLILDKTDCLSDEINNNKIFYENLRDNYLAQNDKSSADSVMYEFSRKESDISKNPIKVLYGLGMGWGYKPFNFLTLAFLFIAIPFAVLWYVKFYYLVLPCVDNSYPKLSKEQFEKRSIVIPVVKLAKIWHVLFFSMSVLLSIRFKKEWIEKSNLWFLACVSLEWLIGILLYYIFISKVKNYEFGYIRGLLGL